MNILCYLYRFGHIINYLTEHMTLMAVNDKTLTSSAIW